MQGAEPASPTGSVSAAPPAAEIIRKMLDTDTWGLGEAEVSARAIIKDDRGVSVSWPFRPARVGTHRR